MRIGELNYSGKATKLIAVLMVCVLVFTLAIPAQPAEAAGALALAAGLTLAFVAACGVAFTVNEAQNSSTYWEGQIDSYLADSGMSDVGEWVDFGTVVYDSASGKLRYPGAVLSGLLDFFGWFTGENSITAGGTAGITALVSYWNGFEVYLYLSEPYYYPLDYKFQYDSFPSLPFTVEGLCNSDSGSAFMLSKASFPGYKYGSYQNYSGVDVGYGPTDGSTITYTTTSLNGTCSEVGFCLLTEGSSDGSHVIYPGVWGRMNSGSYYSTKYITCDYSVTADLVWTDVNYTATASDVIGLPDLEEKETELGYVPDVNIPLPESVAADTNIEDINDASTAVLDYAGTAGNTLDLEYEYANTDTNVDTGTDTETGEGTQEGTGTDAETGTQTGSLTLENVAADSLVEVAPETMLEDDTLLGLFTSKFPWCIPFDLYYAISAFAADPVAPEFEVNLFEGVSWEGLDLSGTEMTLSFEAFEKVAAVTRWSTLIVFCAGLAMITKRMIWS